MKQRLWLLVMGLLLVFLSEFEHLVLSFVDVADSLLFFRLENELDFVFHRNRLNVALSRAKNLCMFVGSDSILNPPIAALATPERREAFAHVKLFAECSLMVHWDVDVEGRSVGGIRGRMNSEDEDDVWEIAYELSEEEMRVLEEMGRLRIGA